MTTRMKPNDYEALSAYLDNELQPRERARLETELKHSAELRRELAELRQTRALLRAQPRLRSPRNFTLTPAMAGARHGAHSLSSAFPTLRLASFLATFFFILVTAGSLYIQRFGPEPSVVAMSPDGRPVQQPGGFGMGGGGGGGAVEPPAAMDVQQAMTESLTITEGPAAAKVLDVTPVAEAASVIEPPLADASGANAPEAGVLLATQAPASGPAPGGRLANQFTGPLLVGVQILLALMAVGAGIAAYLVRRAEQG